jgi:hypothetical protein
MLIGKPRNIGGIASSILTFTSTWYRKEKHGLNWSLHKIVRLRILRWKIEALLPVMLLHFFHLGVVDEQLRDLAKTRVEWQ